MTVKAGWHPFLLGHSGLLPPVHPQLKDHTTPPLSVRHQEDGNKDNTANEKINSFCELFLLFLKILLPDDFFHVIRWLMTAIFLIILIFVVVGIAEEKPHLIPETV